MKEYKKLEIEPKTYVIYSYDSGDGGNHVQTFSIDYTIDAEVFIKSVIKSEDLTLEYVIAEGKDVTKYFLEKEIKG